MAHPSDKAKITGQLTFVVRDALGRVKKLWNQNAIGKWLFRKFGIDLKLPLLTGFWGNQLQFHNLVVSAGKAGTASRINGAGAEAAFTYLAVGTGTTAAAAGDTALQTETTTSGLGRAAATCTRVTTSVTNDTAQLDKTFSVTGTVAVTEAGAFNAASAGTMLGRQVFSAVNVVNGDTLQITYKFQVS